MNHLKRILAMAGVILVAGIWLSTVIIGFTGKNQDLLMAFIVLSVLVPVLIYAMLLIGRVVSGSPAKEELDRALPGNSAPAGKTDKTEAKPDGAKAPDAEDLKENRQDPH